MKLGLKRGDKSELKCAAVKRRAVEPLGKANADPMLDHRQCEVECLDGQIETLTVNTVAQNVMEQTDEDGNMRKLMFEIEAHKSDCTAIPKKGAYVTPSGNARRKRTARGWQLFVQWKDGCYNGLCGCIIRI